MIKITFPDDRVISYDFPITGKEIAMGISPSLAKKSIAVSVNKKILDLSSEINYDAKISIITSENGDDFCLDILRHDTAHLLAQSVKEIYKNDVQITIGPNIENGFYYDIARETPFSTKDLEEIENKMLEISKRNLEIKREEWTREKAIKYFKSIGENYKVEVIEDLFNKEKISFKRDESKRYSLTKEWCSKEEIDNYLRGGTYIVSVDNVEIGFIRLDYIKYTDDQLIERMRLSNSGYPHKLIESMRIGNPEFQNKDFEEKSILAFIRYIGDIANDLSDILYCTGSNEEVELCKKIGFEEVKQIKDRGESEQVIMKFNKSILDQETVTIYKQGDFIDLCRGPHSPSTGFAKYFKLLKVSGAYWRGDSKNKMLQRIYGTAWHSKKALDDYLFMLEESEKRDHRKLGAELDLFHIQEEAPGSVFWHNDGWTIYLEIEKYVRQKIKENGYIEVKTPQMVDRSLWEKSGHWEKFHENMFICETEDKTFAIKPMNCPCHIQIFNQKPKSYRDLPLRMAEFGSCHRNEPSGSLHGMMRVRSFTQDDAHIFCTIDQIESETMAFCKLLFEVYAKFGFSDVEIKFSTRPEIRAGSDEVWDKAEKMLSDAVKKCGYDFTIQEGEGAFYGPKLEFQLRDALGRKWQCGTLQLDFILPERLDAKFVNKNNEKEMPVMLHRAILGSLERFIGILTENYAGKFPVWLAPVQVAVCIITSDLENYAKIVFEKLKSAGIRAILDIDAETLNAKIRNHSLRKIPYICVIGKKEMENNTLTIRKLGSNENFEYTIDRLIGEVGQ